MTTGNLIDWENLGKNIVTHVKYSILPVFLYVIYALRSLKL